MSRIPGPDTPLTVTYGFTGWTINRAIVNKAAEWVVSAMEKSGMDSRT